MLSQMKLLISAHFCSKTVSLGTSQSSYLLVKGIAGGKIKQKLTPGKRSSVNCRPYVSRCFRALRIRGIKWQPGVREDYAVLYLKT